MPAFEHMAQRVEWLRQAMKASLLGMPLDVRPEEQAELNALFAENPIAPLAEIQAVLARFRSPRDPVKTRLQA